MGKTCDVSIDRVECVRQAGPREEAVWLTGCSPTVQDWRAMTEAGGDD